MRRGVNGHGPLWRYENGSIDLETPMFSVRWNCDCMVPECHGRNVIYENRDYETGSSTYDGSTEERFVVHDLPLTCTDAEILAVVQAGPWEYPK